MKIYSLIRFLILFQTCLHGTLSNSQTKMRTVPKATQTIHNKTSTNQLLGPTFTSAFPKKILSLNTRATLIPCTAHGRPAATVEWLWRDETNSRSLNEGSEDELHNKYDNNKISDISWVPVPSSGLLDQLPNGSLAILDFAEDSHLDREKLHLYKVVCKAWNNVGTIISPVVHIRPVVPSQYQMYTIQLMDVFTPVGNTAVFQCTINPYFMPEFVQVVSWQEENLDITAEGRYSLLDHGDLKTGKLHVRNVSVSDSYKKYRCLTRNILTGKERSSNPAHLIVIEASNSPPRTIDHVSSMSATRGSRAELPCVAIAIPMARYRWNKNGVPTEEKHEDRIKLVGGNLLIEETQVTDSGDYRCIAENYIGHQGTSVKLTITAPISVHIESQLQTVDSGKEATLHCKVEGHPIENIMWLKDGKPLMTSSSGERENDEEGRVKFEGGDNSILRVEKVERSDAGMYQCVVVGGGGEVRHASAQVSLGAFPPFILNVIPSQYLDPGTRISMPCVAMGSPIPTITWFVDGEHLPPGRHGDRVSVGDQMSGDGEVKVISHVNITGLKVQDGGRYECWATNEMGEHKQAADVNVFGIPHIKPMRNITTLAGSELEIICRVTGYPVKEIFWKKGNMLLPTNHRQVTSSNGSLLVSRLNRHLDEGWYSCHVINPNDQGMERKFYVRVIDPPKIDFFSFPVRKQGDRVSVSCVMSSGDLPMTLEWRKDGDVIDPDLGVHIHQSGSYSSFLSIEYAKPHHNGNYTCIVTNEGATTNHTSRFHINVPPTWVSEPEDTSAILFGKAAVHCQAFGDPDPRIVWKKSVGGMTSSYQDIDFDDDTRMSHLSNGSLVIESVAREDQGFYLCHASNNIAPDLSKVVHLTVHVPATFNNHDSNISVSNGDRAHLDCHSEGDLPTTLTWSFSNKEADVWSTDPRYQVTYFPIEKGQGSRLTINHVTKEDSGFYVCTAKNSYGSDVRSIHLLVLQSPDPPVDLISKAGVDWVDLKWKEGFDGNSKILEFQVEICREGDTWTNLMTSLVINKSSIRVEHLLPASSYKVRIKARNSVGIGQTSEVVTFDTLELEPSHPPINVSAVAVGSQSILVTWQPIPKDHENGKPLGYSVGYKRGRPDNNTAPYLYATVTNGNNRCQLDGLEKFSDYSIHVRAFNRKGSGPKSEDLIVVTMQDVPSQAPLNVAAISLTSQSIYVTWEPPPFHSLNGVITEFKVTYKLVRDDEDESDSMSQRTTTLRTTLTNLSKYTNYSVQVLACTRMGEGIASPSVYVTTQEDVPDSPSDVKAVLINMTSILVAWLPPKHLNGRLLRYFINITQTEGVKIQIETSPLAQSRLLSSLEPYQRHVIKVGASTSKGDGMTSKEITISTIDRVNAKIAGFTGTLHAQWHNEVIMDCVAGGIPQPIITWRKGGVTIGSKDEFGRVTMENSKIGSKQKHYHGNKMEIMQNGSLIIHDVTGHDADDYKCTARNLYGNDDVTTSLIVQAPPNPPILMVTSVTSNSIQVTWKTTNNGGSKIKGFRLFKKIEHGDWSFVDLDSTNRSHLLTDLLCGSSYTFYMQAFNKMGKGLPSEEVKASTEGAAPIIPPQSMILEEVNSTSVTLTLMTWENGGCPITSFDVAYQVADDIKWRNVQKSIPSNTTSFTVTLNPDTWYAMRVTAHNDAGSTECLLRFSTSSYQGGSTVQPQHLVRKLNDLSLFSMVQKIHVLIPAAVALVVVVVVVGVAVGLFCYRRSLKGVYNDDDKINSGLEVAMVVDDDVTGDQNETNEYKTERRLREGRMLKKEEENLIIRGHPKEMSTHAAVIESEREVLRVSPGLVCAQDDGDDDDDDGDDANDDDDNNDDHHHNQQWYARIPRDAFPDGSELQTAKNSSDDLHLYKSIQGFPPSVSPSTCTCNGVDSGNSTMVTTKSGGGESHRLVEPSGYDHHHHHHPRHGLGEVHGLSSTHHLKERSSHHHHHQHRLLLPPPQDIPKTRCNYAISCHDCGTAVSVYNQLTCTCSVDCDGYSTPMDFPRAINRMSGESETCFPPPPSSIRLSYSSSVLITPTDSLMTSPTSSELAPPSEVYSRHPPFHRRDDVIT